MSLAIVTGGSRGIGAAIAEKLAQDPTSNAVTLDGDTMVTRTSLG